MTLLTVVGIVVGLLIVVALFIALAVTVYTVSERRRQQRICEQWLERERLLDRKP
jgi:hypothetical protein